ncbi:hypothetical protein NPIL_58691 [Nephila pilipes]|uniref:Uncharacterized protein n=1 Tax=Nephila pilipes TaxID=299642 RepID=A0A8X6U2H9_NEPPI|nr:hypothetical protein NPIL_58691 [Nephila pilipes]
MGGDVPYVIRRHLGDRALNTGNPGATPPVTFVGEALSPSRRIYLRKGRVLPAPPTGNFHMDCPTDLIWAFCWP